MKISKYFENWTETDYIDFIDKNEISYFQALQDIGINISLYKIVLAEFSDIFLLKEKERIQKVYLFVSKLEKESLFELLEKFPDYSEYPGNNSYQKIANYFGHNIEDFLLAFDISVIKPAERINESKSIETVIPKYGLRSYQKQCCNDLESLRVSGVERVLLHLPTGAGKTRTAINYACEYLRAHPKKIVVWLADTTELCDQALNAFEIGWRNLGDRNLNRFAMYSHREFTLDSISEGFMVIGIQKFRSITSKDDLLKYVLSNFKERIGLIIFDEAHKALAPSYKLLLEYLLEENKKDNNTDKSYLIGLSATPGRSINNDDENNELSDLFHNNRVGMKVPGYSSPIEYLQERGYLAKTLFKTINYDLSHVNFSLFSEFSEEQFINETLAKDINRNCAIIQHIERHFLENPSSKGIVFSCSLEHSKTLEIWLNGLGYTAKSISGNTPNIIRQNYIERYSNGDIQILINYGVLTAGFDAPCTNSVFITRPTSSLVQYLQMAGRAMRGPKSGGHNHCKVYTVNDEIDAFRNMFKAFDYWNNNWD